MTNETLQFVIKGLYLLVPKISVHTTSVNSDDAAVEEDSSDDELVRRMKKKEESVSKNSKNRRTHVTNATKMSKISATAGICQKAKTDAKQTKKTETQ